ncbi:MAG: type II toxin-antitoxin system VapC family toxin [Candidatus Eremiobacteraeota bacterium]|nr:type II toxin-antitoxin system VapC family toxin [Candidatus Eremiobacteraeota bacterium]MBC5803136.1 type II toxin-antitoxin system VapC family toxin [Candidatus Eremiobacteraeota bacterium]MBC5824587.1 type II toxin-antitoxin system VapC family toxin [Candidatus Eremiobacteraeota bacterium]
MILLDTHVVLWFRSGVSLRSEAMRAIERAARERAIAISAISAWEIGMLASKGRIIVEESPAAYVRALFARADIMEAPVSAEIAELAARLPGVFHGDPADRIITATAATLGCRLATRDKRILGYGRSTRFIGVVAA